MFSRRGRISLTTFWYYTLALAGVFTLLNLIRYRIDDAQLSIAITFMSGFLRLLLIYPGMMVAVKRLHDCSRSGWLVLLIFSPFVYLLALLAITYLISFLRVTIPETLHGITRTVVYSLLCASYLPVLWVFFELGFKRGTVGDNQYGPDPRVGSTSTVTQDPLTPVQLSGELLGEFPHASQAQTCPACHQPVSNHLSTCRYREKGPSADPG